MKKLRLKQTENKIKRHLWTTEEDEAIINLVKKYGVRKWTLISRKLQDKLHIYRRSGKQCRERWHNKTNYFCYSATQRKSENSKETLNPL